MRIYPRREVVTEYMDLYGEDRTSLGRCVNRGAPLAPGEYICIVHVCIFDSSGRLLIQRRQKSKHAWPDLWDLSAGGGVQAGEDSRSAARRETWEELGLELDLRELRPVFTANFASGFDDFYILEQDVALSRLRLQAEEVRDVRWATENEVLSLLAERRFLPYQPSFIPLLFSLHCSGGSFLTVG